MSSHYHHRKKLFADFAKSSMEDWKTLAKLSLSPHDFENLFSPKVLEGLAVKPMYTRADLDKKATEKHQLSYTNSALSWSFQEVVFLQDESPLQNAHQQAMRALEGGVESILFDGSKRTPSTLNTEILLQDIYLDAIDISWVFSQESNPPDADLFGAMRGVMYVNPLENYLASGKPYKQGLQLLDNLLRGDYPAFRCLGVSGYTFAASGASVVQELAYTCNLLVEYLDALTKNGLAPEVLFENLEITLSTRTSLLVDIAKFRAMPLLVTRIAEAYQLKLQEGPLIRAVSAVYNKAGYDLNSNLLRNTSEALGAVLGNCYKICLLPHNGEQATDNPFGRRMARNISHLLRHESHLDLVHDPLAGSYAIEAMTEDLVDRAWQLFQQTEIKGGLLAAFKKGLVQETIQQSAHTYLQDLSRLEKIAVGANRYVPESTGQHQQGAVANLDLKEHDPPLLSEIRGPGITEGVRKMVDQEVNRGKARPRVAALAFSPEVRPAVVSARFAFVKDVLLSVGIVTENFLENYFTKPEKLQLDHSDTVALVIIGDDQAYGSFSDEAFLKMSRKYELPLLIAGKPEQWHTMGSTAFIYRGMHVPAFAEQFFEQINFFDL